VHRCENVVTEKKKKCDSETWQQVIDARGLRTPYRQQVYRQMVRCISKETMKASEKLYTVIMTCP
jgi:hypothetical protein